MLRSFVVAAAVAWLAACRASPTPPPDAASSGGAPLRYVALGDSYTIGTSVAAEERWPDQLVERLRTAAGDGGSPPNRRSLELVANLAVNGYTARNVLERQLPELDALRPAFVSLLIGVNDVVQGVPAAIYEAHAAAILDDLLGRVGADRIVVVSTPDYTVTQQGASYGIPAVQAAGIRESNEVLRRLAGDRSIEWVDIHDLSLRAATDRSLVASDGLHPSGVQYALWVERILPVVEHLLER